MSLIDRRPRLIVGVVLTALVALVAAGWGLAPRPDAAGRSSGPRMAIRLVTPAEPEISPGEVLEVGPLNDGFDRAALDQAPEVDDPTWTPPGADMGPQDDLAALPRMPRPRPVVAEDFPAPSPAMAEEGHPLRDGSRWFGLDRLRADATAARVERRERAERRDRDDRPSRGRGPDPRGRDETRDSMDRRGMDEGPRSSGPVPYYAQPGEYSSE